MNEFQQSFIKIIKRCLILSGVVLVTSCAMGHKSIYDWPQQEGVVVNAETGEPIVGAYVTGRWKGYNFGQSVCFHADATRTDAQGRFVFPAWRNREGNYENSASQQFVTDVYMPGYRDVGGKTLRIGMLPFTGSREERLRSVRTSIAGCNQGGYSRRTFYPALKAIYLEAKTLTQTQEEYQNLERFRYWVAGFAVAADGESGLSYSADSEQELLRKKIIREELQ